MVGEALRNVTAPSISTLKDGMLFIISVAVWPVLTKFLSTLNTFLSIPNSNKGFAVEVTVTLSNCVASCSNLMFPKSLSEAAAIAAKSGCEPAVGNLIPKLTVFSATL